MKRYRIFVRDRDRGMYSCGARDVMALSARDALKGFKGPAGYWHAILWPADAEGQAWLDEHVGDPHAF